MRQGSSAALDPFLLVPQVLAEALKPRAKEGKKVPVRKRDSALANKMAMNAMIPSLELGNRSVCQEAVDFDGQGLRTEGRAPSVLQFLTRKRRNEPTRP
jgi:hypothetical protein